MIYLIIGHRGTGKTNWLNKLKKIFSHSSFSSSPLFIDLDKEVVKRTKKNIKDFFIEKNLKLQKQFRRQEIKTLYSLVKIHQRKKRAVFIALGAGFSLEQISALIKKCIVIHLIRETDSHGRVFLDRPALTFNQSSYKEYQYLYSQREKLYRRFRDEVFVLPEQYWNLNIAEKRFFDLSKKKLFPLISLSKDNLPLDKNKWSFFIKKRLSWGLRFELRDDRFNRKDLKQLLKLIPKDSLLLSFRRKNNSLFLKQDLASVSGWDFPLEKGVPSGFPPILSLHERKKTESVKIAIEKLMRCKADHYKLAIPIYNFKELLEGHLWFLKDPKKHSFLPMSEEGRWRWYRQVFGPQMLVCFIRESFDGVLDQAFLYEHLISLYRSSSYKLLKKSPVSWLGAVLGDPIEHSASPGFYYSFFKKRSGVFVKIPMMEKTFTKLHLRILKKLGFHFFAVTSPLKKKAYLLCDEVSVSAKKFKSVNTLIWKEDKWFGDSTDADGLRALLWNNKVDLKDSSKIAVWGGGGLKPILKQELSSSCFYSARTGKKSSSALLKQKPEILVWAVGRKRHGMFPPDHLKPKMVLDLNYTADSPGKEYALKIKAKYVSGKQMFIHQAKKQQAVFSLLEQQ